MAEQIDYEALSKDVFIDVLERYGITFTKVDNHEGFELIVSDQYAEVMAGLSVLQINLFRAALALKTAIQVEENQEFNIINNYHKMMQDAINKEAHRLAERYADGDVHLVKTDI
jgi:hypothetical protein